MRAYWISRDDGTTNYLSDPAEVGKTHVFDGTPIPCWQGYHGSPTIVDALLYRRDGTRLWVVELSGKIVPHGDPVDKWAAQIRTYLRSIDIRKMPSEAVYHKTCVAARAVYHKTCDEAWAVRDKTRAEAEAVRDKTCAEAEAVFAKARAEAEAVCDKTCDEAWAVRDKTRAEAWAACDKTCDEAVVPLVAECERALRDQGVEVT